MNFWNSMSLKNKALSVWALLWVVISGVNIAFGGLILDTGASATGASVSTGWVIAGIAGTIIVSAFGAAIFTFVGFMFYKIVPIFFRN